MSSPPVRVVEPAVEPVTLAEVKAHLRVDGSSEDAAIAAMIQAAVAHLDGYAGIMGRCLVDQTWRLTLDEFPLGNRIDLLFPDVRAVDVAYLDKDGAAQTLDGSAYYLAPTHGGTALVLMPGQTWPEIKPDTPRQIEIDVTAGYGATADHVPAAIRHAMLLMVGDLYANREGKLGAALPDNPTVMRLLEPYRRR